MHGNWCLCVQPNKLRPSAAKAEMLLVEALEHDADIPLALHLHIHITEASTPNRCLPNYMLCRAVLRNTGLSDIAKAAFSHQKSHLALQRMCLPPSPVVKL